MASSSASPSGGGSTPKDFFELVKAIGESKSKQEEDRIVTDEVFYLKKIIAQAGTTKKKMKELVIRSIYVEMLGQDASFAYIKAVELCASTSITQKRAGYLAASLFLSPDHEFRFMLVNQIQRDMKSSNALEVSAALSAVCKIITEDMIPAVIFEIVKLFNHEMAMIRKKALGAMHRLYQMDKSSVIDHVGKIRRALCDKDPCVMGATLPLFQAMIADDVQTFKDLVPSFVSILKQITEHRLPREFDYHRIPAPWIQMNLLRILSQLGKGDQAASEGMYEVLMDCMKRADTGINVGYAIVYETVKSITTVYPNAVLLDAAATAISRFIRSESHNLKYIGVKGLAAIVKDHPKYATDHQMAVIDCLEDPDETLKRKTLDLLFQMTNAVNVEFIVDKLLFFLANAEDEHFRTALVGQITQCAERFAPSNTWYVQTIIKVFELAGEQVKNTVAQTLMQLIAEGNEEEEEEEDDHSAELRAEAVDHFVELLDKPKLPEILAQSMAWVLGEYGYLSTTSTKEVVMEKLCALFKKTGDAETRAACVTALMKQVAQLGSCPSGVIYLITKFSNSQSLDLQQRCIEFQRLIAHSNTMVDVLPVDASCEDIQVDEDLSFLDSYVQAALEAGARPYSVPSDFTADEEESHSGKTRVNYTPYEMPTIPTPTPNIALGSSGSSNSDSSGMGSDSGSSNTNGSTLTNQKPLAAAGAQVGNAAINSRGQIAQVWGKKPDPVPTPTPTPSNPTPSDGADSASNGTESTSSVSSIPTLNPSLSSSSTDSSAPASVPVPAPKVDPRQSEKEKMAQALFGGLGGSTASKAGKTTRRQTQTPAFAPTPAPTPVDTLPYPAPVPSTAQTAAGAGGGDSLLDMDLLDMNPSPNPNPNPANAPPPIPTAQPSQAMDSLFASAPPSVPPPMPTATPAPASVPNNGSISDIFSDMSMNSISPISTPPPSHGNGVMHPLRIPTSEFGKRWGSCPYEAKVSVRTTVRTLEQLQGKMPTYLHHIESIGNTQESIFATTVASLGSVVLVHAKLYSLKGVCDVTVKSSSGSKEICTNEAASIQASLG